MSADDTTMMSSLASPVAQSKRSQEGNIQAQEDDGSSKAHAEKDEWDNGEKVDLEEESYSYTKVHNWSVWYWPGPPGP